MKNILVLLYHGISEEEVFDNQIRNYNSKHLPKSKFESQMLNISKSCNVISIDELKNNWDNLQRYKKPTVVITFDDGFKNNLSVALPILNKLELPAVFYLSTGNISNQELFWVDKLEIIFNQTFVKNINKIDTPQIFKLLGFKLNSLNIENINNKIKVLDQIKKKLKLYHPKQRTEVINQICIDLEIDSTFLMEDFHPDYSVLNWDDVIEMKKNNLVTIGGHSRFHNILSKLSGEELEKEISGSINDIKKNVGYFSGHYAYPEGQKEHFNQETIKVLKANGVLACPSAIQGFANNDDQSLFDFKRIMVGIDKTSDKFFNNYLKGA